jgi:hypothetical protein
LFHRDIAWICLTEANQATIREIEQGKDVRLSNVERIARASGLTLELVR